MRPAVHKHVGAQKVWARACRRAHGPRTLLQTRKLAEDRVAALDDGRLLGEDRLSRRPEHLRVFESDSGEHHHRRRKHVRRVQTAPEACLDGRGCHTRACHGKEGRHGQHLKLRRLAQRCRQALHGRAHGLHGRAQSALVHGTAQHHHALGKPRDVRRQIGSAAQTVRADERLGIARG